MVYQLLAFLVLVAFYAVYLGKMFSQKKKGIQTDQMAKGKKPTKVFVTELVMKFATYCTVLVEAISIVLRTSVFPSFVRVLGLCLGFAGTAIFAISVWTMRDSWRAGIAQEDKTQMVATGIYAHSRNPAFLGFDLVYIGLLLAFFNWVLLAFSLFAITMLHLQILQEEAFLPSVFGESYLQYRAKVRQYFGQKK